MPLDEPSFGRPRGLKKLIKRTGAAVKKSEAEFEAPLQIAVQPPVQRVQLGLTAVRASPESESRFVLTKRDDMLFIGDKAAGRRKKKASRDANADTQETFDGRSDECRAESGLISQQSVQKPPCPGRSPETPHESFQGHQLLASPVPPHP